MTEEIGVCVVCGKKFTKKNSRQKYCSSECSRYAVRHNRTKHEENPGGEVIRTFLCRRCKTEVIVTDPQDKRLKFCSQRCEKLYWKHPEKAKVTFVARTFQCKGCGKIVEITNAFDRRHTFCSKACQMRYHARMVTKKRAEEEGEKTFICEECKKLVKIEGVGDRRRKFCSAECRQRHHAHLAALKKAALKGIES